MVQWKVNPGDVFKLQDSSSRRAPLTAEISIPENTSIFCQEYLIVNNWHEDEDDDDQNLQRVQPTWQSGSPQRGSFPQKRLQFETGLYGNLLSLQHHCHQNHCCWHHQQLVRPSLPKLSQYIMPWLLHGKIESSKSPFSIRLRFSKLPLFPAPPPAVDF